MPKIPECERCQYFANSPYMVCGINPCGPEGSTCEDFAALSEGAAVEKEPLGGGYYAGDWIPQPFPEITIEEQLALLDWHPQFTGRCPNCETPISEPASRYWNCRHCEWEINQLPNRPAPEQTRG